MNGKSRLVSKSIIRLIPSVANENLVPRKPIQFTVYPDAEAAKNKDKVNNRLIPEAIKAVDFTVEAILTNNRNRPVRKGINRMISNIMASDYQDENNE